MALKLPITVMTKQDLLRLTHEVHAVKEYLIQAKIKHPHVLEIPLPRLSPAMETLFEENKLKIHTENAAKELEQHLAAIAEKAPILHFSFATNPSASFLQRLITWLRTEIDPNAMITIGLQPLISAGCSVRTNNKYYDLSLRQTFVKTQDKLVELMRHGK